MKIKGFWLLVIGLQVGALESISMAAMYKWEDSNGVHFSDNPASIPGKYRNKAINLEPKESNAITDANRDVAVTPEPKQSQPPPAQELKSADNGRDYWVQRFTTIRSELKGLKEGLKGKKERMNEFRRKWLVTQRRAERQSLNLMEDEINRDEERITELERQLEALDAEAARNSVPFEWRQ
jgi:hypothetical protein